MRLSVGFMQVSVECSLFCFLFFHLCLTILLFLASSGDRGTSHTTSNSSKDSSAGISNTNLHGTVSASTAAANNTTASSATSLMSKALAGFGTGGGSSKPKSSGIGAAVVAAAQAQAASEAKQQQQHQMAAAAVQNNISNRTSGNAALQNSSPISAGRN